jgi:multidrug efflux pump subunit AcrA (membrane-fusion protein)
MMAMDVAATSYDRVLPRASVLVSRGLLYLIAITLAVALAWASMTRVNMVVRADGRLAPRAEPVRLSVPQGGIVSKVLVEVGAKVTAGEPILEIDPFREAADAAADRHELEEAQAELARYNENARMLQSATINVSQELASERQVMKLMSEQAKELREGFDGGAVSLFEVQAKEREVAETQAHVSQLASDLTRSDADSRQDLRMETETAQKIKELEIKLSRDVEVKQKTVLVAPTAGVITTMSSLRPGRYLAANDVAATINPSDEPLLAEIWIPNDSMRRIKAPLPVRMKLKAYPYQQFGLLPGTLMSVDPDADQTGAYRAWIKPDRLTINGAHGPETLGPGLQLTAEIVVDHRTILDVILDPIRRVKRGFSIAE